MMLGPVPLDFSSFNWSKVLKIFLLEEVFYYLYLIYSFDLGNKVYQYAASYHNFTLIWNRYGIDS